MQKDFGLHTESILDQSILIPIRQFVDKLKQDKLPISQILIFGSWAKGTATQYSDIDIGVVSSQFGKDEMKEMAYLLKKTRGIDAPIEPHPVGVIDLQNETTPLYAEIKKWGKNVLV